MAMANAWDSKRKKNMEALLGELEADGGLKVLPMLRLRDAAGWDKLGARVVVDISNLLGQYGMATLPAGEQLPVSQTENVRVYSQRSKLGSIIEAVLQPSGKGDQILREAATSDAGDVLDRIRTLVCAE
jgi:hypothetical protein